MKEKIHGYSIEAIAIGIKLIADQLENYGLDISNLTTYGILSHAAGLINNSCQEFEALTELDIDIYNPPPPPSSLTHEQKIEVWEVDWHWILLYLLVRHDVSNH